MTLVAAFVDRAWARWLLPSGIAALALFTATQCDRRPQPPPKASNPRDGGAGAGGGLGSDGSGGFGGTFDTGSDSGGAAQDAGQFEDPRWEEVGSAYDCIIERVTNPRRTAPVFSWQSCGDSCEETSLELSAWFPGSESWETVGAVVRGEGSESRVALNARGGARRELPLSLLADDLGHVLAAYRASAPEASCTVDYPAVWSLGWSIEINRAVGEFDHRWAALVTLGAGTDEEELLVHEFGSFVDLGIVQDMSFGLGRKKWVGQLGLKEEIFALDLGSG